MEAPIADPLYLPNPPTVECSPPDIQPALPDYVSLDVGVVQAVRDLHVQIENYLKALPVNEERIVTTVDALVGLDCPLPVKFSKISASDLIKKNKNVKGPDESLPTLVAALGFLEKYGRNLMKPACPPQWKFINFTNGVFKARVDIIKGARGVLQLMGYSQVVENGLCFPSDQESPNMDTVAMVTADLAIARREVELYHKGSHPHAYRFKDCLDGTMAVVQLPGESPSGRPQNVFMRLPADGRAPTYENFELPRSPNPTGQSRLVNIGVESEESESPPTANSRATTATAHQFLIAPALPPKKPNVYAPLMDPSRQIEGIVRKIGEPPAPSQRTLDGTKPGSTPVSQNTTVQPSSTAGTQNESTLPSDQDADQDILCVMCGNVTAKLQCSTCSGLRCEACDQKWHQHWNRRGHVRQAIQYAPVTSITEESPPATVPCHLCGINSASMFCVDCSSSSCSGKYCSDCDMVFHGNPFRQQHTRKPLQSKTISPAVKQPPQNIMLSPVSSPQAPDNESSSALLKKRPVPAPRHSVLKKSVHPSETVSPEDKVVPDYVSVTRQPQRIQLESSDAKEPSPTNLRPLSESAIPDVPGDPSPPKPDRSLPSTKADITSEIETVLQMDISLLQMIQAGRDAIVKYDKSSPMYQSLQSEIRYNLTHHNKLIDRQLELEKWLASAKSSPAAVEERRQINSGVRRQPMAADPLVSLPQIKHPPVEFPAPGVVRPAQPSFRPVGIPFTYQGPRPTVSASKPSLPAKPPSFSPTEQSPTATLPVASPPAPAPSHPQTIAASHQSPVIDNAAPALVQPERAHHRVARPPAPSSVADNQAPPRDAWVCLNCGNHNAAAALTPSAVCTTCGTPTPSGPPQKSVAALGQQLRAFIRMPTAQHDLQKTPFKMKPTLTAQPKTEPPPQPSVPKPGVPKTPTLKTQPETMSVFTYLQFEEEAILQEKHKAQEEYDRQQALAAQTEKEPSPPPRYKKSHKQMENATQPKATLAPATKVTNQGGSYVPTLPKAEPTMQWLEQKRRLEEQRVESMEFIKMLRAAEDSGYLPEEVVAASQEMRVHKEKAVTELQWLQANWEDYINTVTAMATNSLNKEVGKSVGMVRKDEARRALWRQFGDVQSAVEECVTEMQTKVLSLVDMGFSHRRVCESLSTRDGGADSALVKLQQERAADFVTRIWLEEDVAEKEKLIVDLGVDRHPDTVERRLRMLLAEFELPSWGRSITATHLIDTGKYVTDDAITAARECGDFERATQYLEKECQVCYSRFSMNKLSTLMHCQCMMCLECLHDHFQIVINTRNILNANCPACDQPDLRQNDLDATADYFGFLDILLKGILDSDSYQVFQVKMRDWNLMREANFRWCAHCGNGFINEAPNRRKMRCNECNKLTCFQCKKPWMEQHENISCAEFQSWKEANDPNRAAEGLAIHLKENGIDCPHCKMRYELAKGGCMHFKCVQCTYEFCCGCSSPFKKANECGRFGSCAARGLHAHHPRDCLFYLRDQETKALQKLLQKHKVDYKRDNPANEQPVCNVMEQKELPDGLKDDHCGRVPVHAGLCIVHYKEYLVSLINQNHIDPATELDNGELVIILQRNEVAVPARADRETEAAYGIRLYQEVNAHLPLEKKNPRDRAQSQ